MRVDVSGLAEPLSDDGPCAVVTNHLSIENLSAQRLVEARVVSKTRFHHESPQGDPG